MTALEYLETVKERLLTDELIAQFEIVRERITSLDGYLRVRLVFVNDTRLEFAEYFQLQPDGAVVAATYSFQWTDANNALICRWDNTPHFPDLDGFPHHIHKGASVLPGQPMSIFTVLDHIAQQI